VRILLDTQIWLWMLADPGRLTGTAKDLVTDPSTELLLSAASTWEIAIKTGLGRLTLPGPPTVVVPKLMEETGVTALSIQPSHTLRVASLPPHHRDPFDRLLVAQAQLEDVPIMSADPAIGRYEVERLDP
jgi:PIN domain nuclease of toxin-antitoxin system